MRKRVFTLFKSQYRGKLLKRSFPRSLFKRFIATLTQPMAVFCGEISLIAPSPDTGGVILEQVPLWYAAKNPGEKRS